MQVRSARALLYLCIYALMHCVAPFNSGKVIMTLNKDPHSTERSPMWYIKMFLLNWTAPSTSSGHAGGAVIFKTVSIFKIFFSEGVFLKITKMSGNPFNLLRFNAVKQGGLICRYRIPGNPSRRFLRWFST